MSEVINTNKYLDFGGLKKYDELIKQFIANGNNALADAIAALDSKIGAIDIEGSDDKSIAVIVSEIYASIAEIVEKQDSLDEKDTELEGKIEEEIGKIVGDLNSLGDGVSLMTLVEVANKLKALDDSVSKNTQDIVDVKDRVSAVEEAIKNLGEIEGGESLGEIVSEVKLNTAAIATLKGDENAEGSVKKAAKDAAAAAQAAAEATAAADASTKANNAQASAIEAAAADATSKADAAQAAAIEAAATDATSKANAAQAAAEATAKAYVDAIAHASDVKYEGGYINLYDASGKKIGEGFDASPFVVDGMLDSVEFVADSDSDAINTTLRFTFNTDGGKKEIDVDFSEYVDVYHGDNNSIVLDSSTNTFSVNEVAATKTKTVESIPVAGGPLESLLKNAGINEIAAGTSIEDVLFSLICKELWASELTFSEGTVASSIDKPTFTLTKDSKNVSGTVEIGTKVVLSDITMGSATPSVSKNRTYSGFTYGYSAANDNSQDSSNTTITAGIDKDAELNEGNYTMSRDYTGFNGATDDSATANADASKVSLSGATLVVGDGSNKVKVTVGGPTASATFAAMPVYYACSNLKKTKDAAKDADGQYKSVAKDSNTVTSSAATNSKELSVTGARYMFWGAHAEHKTLDSAIIREHANGGTMSTQAKTVTITIPESGVNQFYVALPSGRKLTKVYNTAAGEQFGEVTDSFTSSTIAVEGAEGYTSANYTVWTFNSGTSWVGPNTLTVIIG